MTTVRRAMIVGVVGLMAAVGHAAAQVIVVDFDTAANWTAGSGALNSYQSDHVYSESGLHFTGGPALRETAGTQDGHPKTSSGDYAWRLRDQTVVDWFATYTLPLGPSQYISSFGFMARRWDGSPSPAYTVSYTVDGGANWTTASQIGSAGVLDNAAFGNSSAYSEFVQTLLPSETMGLPANQFQVRFSATSGERIMVDDFRLTIVPEPSTMGLMAGIGGLLCVLRRSRRLPLV